MNADGELRDLDKVLLYTVSVAGQQTFVGNVVLNNDLM